MARYFTPTALEPLSDECAAILRDDFVEVDTDGSGYIEIDELGVLLRRQLGRAPSVAEIEGTMAMFDTDGDGRISFDEYMEQVIGDRWSLFCYMQRVEAPETGEGCKAHNAELDPYPGTMGVLRRLTACLNKIETDADGLIPRAQWAALVRVLGESEERAQELARRTLTRSKGMSVGELMSAVVMLFMKGENWESMGRKLEALEGKRKFC
eukprot:TRINITY_DN16565_c0_g1_i1.p1 TRINITY_DN16565_c0_g1~~TRINITY_DN16565_c0_g1_i1.p1  ORF type:complete len:210 (-),score=60.59 TRINITY_DN16565_c0_g1_i1:363-992(-)